MTSRPGATPVQLRVNLDIVSGHYANATRPHLPPRARAAQFAAIRDIPFLINEIERLWALLTDALVRHANLRAAALATMTAYQANETDPLSYLRAGLYADRQHVLS